MAVWQLWGSWYDRDEFDFIQRRITKINSVSGETRVKIITQAIEDGLVKRETELAEGIDSAHLALVQEIAELRGRKSLFKRYEELLEAKGRDGFIHWCKETEQSSEDWQMFLEGYIWRLAESWSFKLSAWLDGFLFGYERRSTEQIRAAVEAVGLLNGTEQDWAKLRAWASRNGYTDPQHSGYWHAPERARAEFMLTE